MKRMLVFFSHANCRKLPHLLSTYVNHMRLINGSWREERRTRMVIAMACWMVHRLLISIRFRTMAFRRLLYLCESLFFSLG